MKKLPMPSDAVLRALQQGVVSPAHPLALDKSRKLDEVHQRALTRYYLAAGAGGLAVAVHTTQFEIRLPQHNLLQPVLRLAVEEAIKYEQQHSRSIVKIAGVVGKTAQALQEADLAAGLGYDAALLSLKAFAGASNSELLDHCRRVAEKIPLIGFYLQTAVGGRVLDTDFWRQFCHIENVLAIKIAPFNRYYTLDVLRGVAESGRAGEIALYTGNDDSIIVDLLTPVELKTAAGTTLMQIVGGLLGHYAVWTQKAVEHFDRVRSLVQSNRAIPSDLLTLAAAVTDCNGAFFDVANQFRGVIVGIHEVLRRQGLMSGTWTLDPDETLSEAQAKEIDRVYHAYPHLNDDAFIAAHLPEWLKT
ncbi:MAG TPA: dihydrodipicolinate synthase family protein [bacterium]|nr:dihydrodipicolinate synthase family protein [bacterium]HPG46441.1 dihydrodipicolinate synthase family protein [bacterium]HPM98646.1 dihydrodipicolinate synthase family protein [bacterium]